MIGKPFSNGIPILKIIEQAGFEAYFVGGSVRDHILGREISDVDIATSALPAELKMIFPKTTDVGIEHGTILVHYKGIPYEITTFRSESGYTDFRRPDQVSFIRSLVQDLQRRDFTMNAMAMDKDGKVSDPFNGQGDMDRKRIVTVGNPDERFGEDALRMLRAVRFLSQLSFSIETGTLKSLKTFASLLSKIAVERKLSEFEKIMNGQNRSKAFELLASSGLYQYLPGLNSRHDELITLSKRHSNHLGTEEMWTLLLYELKLNSNGIDAFLREWKLPVQKMKKLKQLHSLLVNRMEVEWTKESVYKAGIEAAICTERVYTCIFGDHDSCTVQIKEIHEQLPIKNRTELVVTGNDLMSWLEKEAGPWIKATLEEIETAVIHREVENEREKIKEWLSK
jgi:tRNA nucleotidyltransferase (CCA-adding enzyme)